MSSQALQIVNTQRALNVQRLSYIGRKFSKYPYKIRENKYPGISLKFKICTKISCPILQLTQLKRWGDLVKDSG